MSNLDRAFGLEPIGKMLGANLYAFATSNAAAIYLQCLVEHNGTSYTTRKGAGIPGCYVEETGAAGSLLGSVIALFDSDMNPINYLPITTTGDAIVAGYALVADHPMQQFLIQEDGDTTPVAAASIGLNADLTGTGGSTVTGLSTQEIDSDTVNTTSTLAVKILRAHPDDTVATANCRFIVQVNAHHNGSGIDGV